jgi:hypothetical protein
MMRSDVPNPKLPITTVQVGSPVDGKASITCSQRQSENQGCDEEPDPSRRRLRHELKLSPGLTGTPGRIEGEHVRRSWVLRMFGLVLPS